MKIAVKFQQVKAFDFQVIGRRPVSPQLIHQLPVKKHVPRAFGLPGMKDEDIFFPGGYGYGAIMMKAG